MQHNCLGVLVKYAALLFSASVTDSYCGLDFSFLNVPLLLENLPVACSLSFPSCYGNEYCKRWGSAFWTTSGAIGVNEEN